MRSIWALITGLIFGALAGWLARGHGDRVAGMADRDTVTMVESVTYREPRAADSVETKYVTRYLPMAVHDTIFANNYAQECAENIRSPDGGRVSDSAAVLVPITQKMYKGEGYRAWVSGYEASLDSISLYRETIKIRERESKPPDKWHIGVTGGLGIGGKGWQPFVGVGLMYSIISF